MARGRPGASDGDIQQAIEQILAEGDEPSLIKIRKRSGASYGTIGPIFERWRAQRQKQRPVEIPTTLRERGAAILEAALQAVWAEAAATMQEQVTKVRDQAEREVEEAQQEQHEAEEALTELEEENTTQAQALDEAQAQIVALHVELEQARATAGAATARADELASRVQSAEQRLAAAENERKEALEQTQQTARELGRLEGEANSLRQLVERLTPGTKSGQ